MLHFTAQPVATRQIPGQSKTLLLYQKRNADNYSHLGSVCEDKKANNQLIVYSSLF